MDCNSTLCEDINVILKKGWGPISNKYAKEINTTQSEIELKLLTGLRIYYIDKLFQCARIEKSSSEFCEYYAFGSTNITSDYDLTIIGKKAPEIMLYIFNTFLKNINKTSTFSFDTNLYCMGFYSSKGLNDSLNKYFVREKLESNLVSFQPKTENDKKICLKYAKLKLLEAGLLKNNESNLLNNTEVIDLENNLKEQLAKCSINNISNKKNNTIDLDLIKRYYMYYNVSKKLFKFLYNNNKNNNNNNKNNNVTKENFIDYMCKGLYYSIEAYYTPCTVNVVVLEMQAGKNIGLDPFNYLISAIENLGDFNIHLQQSGYNLSNNYNSSESKKIILKLSKYLYRFYYSLNKLNDNKNINKVNKIKNNIMIKRSSGKELKGEDLKLINGFNGNSISLRTAINNFNKYALNQIKIHSNSFFK